MTSAPPSAARRHLAAGFDIKGCAFQHEISRRTLTQFVDLVACRLLLVATAILAASGAGFLAIIAIRLFSDLAIPGWSSTVLLGLLLVFIQALTLALILVFASFGRSTQLPLVPADHYMQFLASPTSKVGQSD